MRRVFYTAVLVFAIGVFAAPGTGGVPPTPAGDTRLVTYSASDRRSVDTQRFDYMEIFRDGTGTLARYAQDRRTRWRILSLGERRLSRLRDLLRRAGRLKDSRTQPYPTIGRQALRFGRDRQHKLLTLPTPSLPPMRGKLRRKLFRHMDCLRQRTWRPD